MFCSSLVDQSGYAISMWSDIYAMLGEMDKLQIERTNLRVFDSGYEQVQVRVDIEQYQSIAEERQRLTDERQRVDDRYYLLHEHFWKSTQALITFAGNVSKILWPQRAKYFARGEYLRKVLEVPENSPLASRSLRNCFEHFDERLEDWYESTKGEALFLDRSWLSVDREQIPTGPKDSVNQNYFRYYDPVKNVVGFHGNQIELKPLLFALGDINRRAEELKANWP